MTRGQEQNTGLWQRLARLPLLLLAALALLAGLWAGLLRIGWSWPDWGTGMAAVHGPLMVSGFLGTIIGLERAVALGRRPAYLPPLLSGAGAALLLLAPGTPPARLLVTAGSAGLVLVFVFILRRHTALYTVVMALGAALWLLGNVIWLSGRTVTLAVPWWIGFLVLTIAGERLELSRVLRYQARTQVLFGMTTALSLVGVAATFWHFGFGMRVAGAGLVSLALWLLVYDIARRNLRHRGLTRYMAVCLFSGYIWLAVGGVLALWYGGLPAGPLYDAMLHAIFLGFVFAMIFGHMPIIFPAVSGRSLSYRPAFYGPLVLLHLSLLLRLAGDLLFLPAARRWGGLLNALVVVLFLVVTMTAARRGQAGSVPQATQKPDTIGNKQ